MATYRGFVDSVQIRDDGWVEFVVQAVHAGNARKTFFIESLDGEVESANRRLGQLSLLRDALSRILPVEVEYQDDPESGALVEDLTITPRPSIDGRRGARRIEGVVIGVALTERGPESGSSPYRDEADLAGATLLSDDGTIEQVLVDLQRPDPLTGHAMLKLLEVAHRTRRPVAVLVTSDARDDKLRASSRVAAAVKSMPGYVQACEWITVPEELLDEVVAFVERLGQRYESFDPSEAIALSKVRVTYTTAPEQTPEGDVSENGTFVPETLEAWVHGDSPLLHRLEAALRDRLQVRLGLSGSEVHAVDVIGRLGSAARPIWVQVDRRVLEPAEGSARCENVPTIQTPTTEAFGELPVAVSWTGDGFFNEGIWRFVVRTPAQVDLRIDGELCPCGQPSERDHDVGTAPLGSSEASAPVVCHAYLNGMHRAELILTGRTCSQPFQLRAYRIR
jgi:hypothetical protein